MTNALQDLQQADVVFVLEGTNRVKAHKVILCSACNYFSEVFGCATPTKVRASSPVEETGSVPVGAYCYIMQVCCQIFTFKAKMVNIV